MKTVVFIICVILFVVFVAWYIYETVINYNPFLDDKEK